MRKTNQINMRLSPRHTRTLFFTPLTGWCSKRRGQIYELVTKHSDPTLSDRFSWVGLKLGPISNHLK